MLEHETKDVNRTRKCELLNIKRKTMYYKAKDNNGDGDETVVVNEMMDIYLDYPFYGYRRILIALLEKGFEVTESIVRR